VTYRCDNNTAFCNFSQMSMSTTRRLSIANIGFNQINGAYPSRLYYYSYNSMNFMRVKLCLSWLFFLPFSCPMSDVFLS